MTSRHQRNFRRGGTLIRNAGRPLMTFRKVETPASTYEALQGPCVIASNHRSVFDALAGMYAVGGLGHSARTLSAAWLWDDLRLGRMLDAIGAIPLPAGRGAVEAVDRSVEVLRRGEHLLMTPEGRVVPAEDRVNGVGAGAKILSKIVTAANVPVIPAALVGTDRFWPLGASRPTARPWNRTVIGYGFGAPIHCRSTNHRDNVDAVMAGISSLIREIEPLVPDEAPIHA